MLILHDIAKRLQLPYDTGFKNELFRKNTVIESKMQEQLFCTNFCYDKSQQSRKWSHGISTTWNP